MHRTRSIVQLGIYIIDRVREGMGIFHRLRTPNRVVLIKNTIEKICNISC